MTEPQPTPPGDSNLSAILVAVTRIDGKLDTALAVQAIHSNEITENKRQIAAVRVEMAEQGNRITALETVDQRDNQNDQRTYSGRAVVWTAIGTCIAAAALLVVILLAVKGGSTP